MNRLLRHICLCLGLLALHAQASWAADTSEAAYLLQAGETHAAGDMVGVTGSNGSVVATLTFGFAGEADFTAAKSNSSIDGFNAYTVGNGVNGGADRGTTYIIVPAYNGVVTVGVMLNANKAFYVLEDEMPMDSYNGIMNDVKYMGTYSFNVKAGSTYKVYGTGTKLGFFGFTYVYSAEGGVTFDAYTLTTNVQPSTAGSVNPSGSQTLLQGATVKCSTSRNNSDYAFQYWCVGDSIVSSNSSFTFTMPGHNAVLTAVYKYSPTNPNNPVMPAKQYALTLQTAPAGAGSFNTSSPSKYEAGTQVYLTAYNNNGYEFVCWLENGDTLSKNRSFYYAMPERDAALTAVYRYNPSSPANPDTMVVKRYLRLESQPAGAGSFNWSTPAEVQAGESVSVYAYSNNGWRFREWQQDGVKVSDGNRYYFTMPANDVRLVALYDYNPTNPANPGKNYWNSETGEVIVDDFETGDLNSTIYYLVGGSYSQDVTMITVSGRVNSNDWYVASNFSGCTWLDMSRTTGMTTVPSWTFENNRTLTDIKLPASIETIEYYAFYNCSSLQSIACYALTPPTIGGYAFEGIADGLVVYVPAAALGQYQEAEGWKNFTILPLQDEVSSLEVNLPAGTDPSIYKDMYIELVNTKSGQKLHYVITNRTTYTFNSLIHDTQYNVYLKNAQGNVLGQINGVDVKKEDVSVTFESLMVPRELALKVLTPAGEDVTDQTNITWTDEKNAYLAKGSVLSSQLEGMKVRFRITLSQQLGMQYLLPVDSLYNVQAENHISLTLRAIPQTTIGGRVLDIKTGQPLSGATVAVSQMLNGLYSKSFTAKTDNKGQWSLQVYEAKTDITASMDDYVSKTQSFEMQAIVGGNLQSPVVIPDFELKDINGTTIAINLTYQPTGGELQEYYSDYANVAYTVYNATAGKNVTELNVQYPQIVLMEQLPAGTVLRITATSKNQKFVPVTATATVDSLDRARVTLPIKQLGGITASFRQTDNPAVVGILYDGNGRLLKKYEYASATLNINELQDGQYTLVTMASTQLFSTVGLLSQFAEAGLREGVDYVKNSVTVRSGEMAAIDNSLIPFLDETKLYYTGDGTSVSVNKSQITTGNYLTITGHLDFKSTYADKVSDVKFIVDLPEECAFVDNSVMRGAQTATYTYADNQVVVPLDYYGERVRFCFIPTVGGEFTSTGSVQFTLGGKTIIQPIGNVKFTVKDLSITVPSTIAKTTVPISGAAPGKSSVEIYDDGMLIGSTTSLANGTWVTTCELNEPYNLSTHNIYAKVTTTAGMELVSETKQVVYDKSMVEPEKVTMLYYNPEFGQYKIIYDLINRTVSPHHYYFFPYKSWPNWSGSGTEPKDFTFIADLSNNDSTAVNGVTIRVYTENGYWRNLEAQYNTSMNRWVAVSQFWEEEAPVGVEVEIDANSEYKADRTLVSKAVDDIEIKKRSVEEQRNEYENLLSQQERDSLQYDLELNQLETLTSQIEMLSSAENYNDVEMASLISQYCTLMGFAIDTESIYPEAIEEMDEETTRLFLLKCKELIGGDDGATLVDSVKANINSFDFEILSKDSLDYETVFDAIEDTLYYEHDGVPMMIYQISPESIDWSINDSTIFEHLSMTEGKDILVYAYDKELIIIDQERNIAWIAQPTDNVYYASRRIKRINGQDVVESLRKAVISIQTFINGVFNWVNDKSQLIKDEISEIEKQLAKLDKDYSRLISQKAVNAKRLSEIERQFEIINQGGGGRMFYDELEDMKTQLKVERGKLMGNNLELSKQIQDAKSQSDKLKNCRTMKLALLGTVLEYWDIAYNLYKLVDYGNEGIRDIIAWNSFINSILPCKDDEAQAKAIQNRAEDNRNTVGGRYGAALAISTVQNAFGMYMTFNPAAKSVKWAVKTLAGVVNSFLGNIAQRFMEEGRNLSKQYKTIREKEKNKLKCNDNKCPRCGKNPCECKDKCPRCGNRPCTCPPKCPRCGNNPCVCPPPYPRPDVEHDPSGYVYEGVASNRLQGVMASCYYKETVEDMYGDLHENVVLWDAEEYAQQNPLFTDEYGMYRWDVPKGLWQVKFEKEGYQTTYSEWLPVPPPQLEVNIAMTQLLQPTVLKASAFDEGVEMEFDKYMDPETLTGENITVTKNGEKVEGTIELLNEEVAYEGQSQTYASKVRFNVPEGKELLSTDEVQLTVSRRVKSYAGVTMEQDYTQSFTVEPKVRSIAIDSLINVAYGGTRTLTVAALPADASKGKKMVVKSLSSMIATVSVDTLLLDENGHAELVVSGELPGSTVLNFTVAETDVENRMMVHVKEAAKLVTIAPRASRVSGTQLYRGTEIRLTSETEGAAIYYTLDGSCPCDTATAIKYDANSPIVIASDTVTIKAMALGHDLAESDVAEFSYTLKKTSVGYHMPEGWTWISHNMEEAVPVSKFENNAERIMSQTKEVIKDPVVGMVGNLKELIPTESYKVKVSAQTENSLQGYEFNAAQNGVTVESGWNWIGYPVNQSMTVAEAFTYYDASEGDYIVGQNGFAEFTNGEWKGTLEGMTPGLGYLYKSAVNNEIRFNTTMVSVAASRMGMRNYLANSPWAPAKNAYPNIMPLTAQLYDNGTAANADNYVVGAFAGTECRGVGIWQDNHLLMTVYGQNGEEISFVARRLSDDRYFDIAEKLNFTAETCGSWNMPFVLTINDETTSIDQTYSGINVTPAIAHNQITVTAGGKDISYLSLTNMSGKTVVVLSELGKGATVTIGQLPEGVYVVTVNADGQSYYKKIIKASK